MNANPNSWCYHAPKWWRCPAGDGRHSRHQYSKRANQGMKCSDCGLKPGEIFGSPT